MLDVYLPFMSNAQERKYVVIADLSFSGAWIFLWFVCFCLLASQWGRTHNVGSIPEDAARATVAFSFFSIATWGILTYFALGRFRRGVNEVTIPTYTEPPPDHHTSYPPTYAPTSYNPTPYTPTTYTAYPSSVADMHQQPPYTPNAQLQGDAGYQPPSYWGTWMWWCSRSSFGGLVVVLRRPRAISYWCSFMFVLTQFSKCCQIFFFEIWKPEQCSCKLEMRDTAVYAKGSVVRS